MALPPSPISGDPGAVPPPGADMASAPPDDAGTEGDDGWTVCATIMENKALGKFKVIEGDEAEDGEMPAGGPAAPPGGEAPADEGQTFDTPQEVLRALMPILDGGSTDAAEKSFGDNFRSTSKGGSDMAPPPLAG